MNTAPALAAITSRTVNAGSLLSLTAVGTDADLPAQTLTYSLVTPPAGAAINAASGLFTWTPTAAQIGTHNVTIQVADNATPAASASRTFTVTVNAASTADLVLTAFTTTATAVRAGSTLSVSSTATNQGTASAGASVVTFRLSSDALYGGTDDIVVTATRSVSSLAVSASSTGSTTLTAPASTPPGAYYVCAMADGNSTVTESNESNNTRCTAQTIQVTLPDLVLASIQASPNTVRRGARFDVVNQVSNTGAVPSQASTVEIRLSLNTIFGDADDIVLNSGSRSVNTLAAGASSSATTRPRVPLAMPLGDYYVCGMADVSLQVPETNEANNSRCTAVTIRITN